MKADKSTMDENLGLVNPIGSTKNIQIIRNLNSFYLNEGIGAPWAGQVKAMPEFKGSVNFDDSSLLANFGFAEPIGSEIFVFI